MRKLHVEQERGLLCRERSDYRRNDNHLAATLSMTSKISDEKRVVDSEKA